jgi:hypothetical protein
MKTETYLVSIEGAGKQRYLAEAATFTEVAGASQLIRNLGVDAWNHVSERVVEKFSDDFDVKLHQQTSGKVLLSCTSLEIATEIVWQFELWAWKNSPGLMVIGGIVPLHELANDQNPMMQVISRLSDNRRLLSPPSSRFTWESGGRTGDTSVLRTIMKKSGSTQSGSDMRTINDESKSVGNALLHFDGNGIGQIFRTLHLHNDESMYLENLQKVSQEIDDLVQKSLNMAVNAVGPDFSSADGSNSRMISELVVAGDDVTLRTAVPDALQVALNFQNNFVGSVMGDKASGLSYSSSGSIVVSQNGVTFKDSLQVLEEGTRFAKALRMKYEKHSNPRALGIDFLFQSNGVSLGNCGVYFSCRGEECCQGEEQEEKWKAWRDVGNLIEKYRHLRSWLDDDEYDNEFDEPVDPRRVLKALLAQIIVQMESGANPSITYAEVLDDFQLPDGLVELLCIDKNLFVQDDGRWCCPASDALCLLLWDELCEMVKRDEF